MTNNNNNNNHNDYINMVNAVNYHNSLQAACGQGDLKYCNCEKCEMKKADLKKNRTIYLAIMIPLTLAIVGGFIYILNAS